MNKEGINISKIMSWIFTIIAIIVIVKAYQIYKKHYFGDFLKAENEIHISNFYRDNNIKYSNNDSYKIESPDYNDAVFYKEIEVKPNTPYRVTCMVKTENIVQENEGTDAGAMICLLETTEVSENIIGTNDWQKLTFIFNSKNRETVKIAFRLGGNLGKCKGSAWFSDFKLEQGISNNDDTEWKIACFIFENMKIKNEHIDINTKMTLNDIENIKVNVQRFARTCKELSENQMSVDYDIYQIEEPLTSVTYDEKFEYHITPEDVKDIIGDTVIKNEYDHIIVVVRMGDGQNGIQINAGDWIGLRRYGII